MKISDWPIQERPLEKLLNKGPENLSDAELLALFIRSGVPGKSAVDVARTLLVKFGTIRQVLEVNCQELCTITGIGEAKYGQLQGALELGRRYFAHTLYRENVFTNAQDTRRYLVSQLRGESREVFAVLLLDSQHHLIAFERLFYGTIDSAAIYPREIVKLSLSYNATAVILAHNHPSGKTQPSAADKDVTQHIRKGLNLVDIQLLDHFIIGEGNPFSFAENGLC
jgi:DNA repair protein RadC